MSAVAPELAEAFARDGAVSLAAAEIDEQGEVRMPAVMKSDYPELAEAAIAAVRQWKFEPPTRRVDAPSIWKK